MRGELIFLLLNQVFQRYFIAAIKYAHNIHINVVHFIPSYDVMYV